ncbi:DUF6097 family protein [Pectobacterium parmentieri]|uniref:DUF6097 family protein n=2 Tax=Pectobacterium parmentieri TaxID=1905730 RepID=UPI00215B3983|nr:DUF6097 family protein [Pectobacterium parmentieri]
MRWNAASELLSVKENIIMGYSNILGKVLDNAQRLKEVHYHIEHHHIPVTSKDDLSQQIIEIERYLGDSSYTSLNTRKHRINILSAILALPVLLFCFIFVPDRYLKYFNIEYDIDGMAQSVFLFLIEHMWMAIAYGASFFGLIFYFYYLNHRAENEAEKVIQAFIARTSSNT